MKLSNIFNNNSPNMPAIIMIGNPGAGKSTLLSSLVRQSLFLSGPSIGRGKTTELKVVEHQGNTYIDTPGLSDVKLREKAASEIERAFKMGGTFKVFFVMTLESGRVRPDEVATMKLVLDAVPQIGSNGYSIIINKVSKSIVTILNESSEEREELAACLVPPTIGRGTRSIFYVPIDPLLIDETNKLCQLSSELLSFISNAPSINVSSEQVQPIQIGNFEKICDGLRESIQRLREDNEALRRTMAEREAELGKLQWASQYSFSAALQLQPYVLFISDSTEWIKCYRAMLNNLILEKLKFHPYQPQQTDAPTNKDLDKVWKPKKYSGVVYIHTPGLSHRSNKEQNAKNIDHALQRGGTFNIFFTATLEKGLKINANHLNTIKQVLWAATQIGDNYSVIFMLSPVVYNEFITSEDGKWKDLVPSFIKDGPRAFFIPEHSDWTDKRSKIGLELQKFITEAPEISITVDQLRPIRKHK